MELEQCHQTLTGYSVDFWRPYLTAIDKLLTLALPNLIHDDVHDLFESFYLLLNCTAHSSACKAYRISHVDWLYGFSRKQICQTGSELDG
jgi:hypothetical protein